MPDRRRAWSVPGVLATAYCVGVAAFAGIVSHVALREQFIAPYRDDWRILDHFYSMPFWDWLLGSDVGYRLPATLLLMYLDQTFLAGEMRLLVIVSLICALVSVWALHRGLHAGGRRAGPLSASVSAFGAFALFWAWGSFSFYWGANQGSVMTVMWWMVCIAALARVFARCRGPSPHPGKMLVLAVVAAILATFCHGMGPLIWASALAIAIVGRLPVGIVAALAIAGGIATTVNMIGLPVRVAELGPRSLSGAREILEFAIAFVGAPVGAVLAGIVSLGVEQRYAASLGAGVVGITAFGVYATRLLLRPAMVRPNDLVALGLMLCPILAGLLVAIGRMSMFGPTQAIGARFVGWSIVFWIGAACSLAFVERWQGNALRQALLVGLIAGSSLAMTPAWSDARFRQAVERRRLAHVTTLLLLGVRYPPSLKAIFPGDPEVVWRAAERLRQGRRSPFADLRRDLVGSRLSEHFEVAPRGRCRGAMQVGNPLRGPERSIVRVSGWAWDVVEDRPPAFIVIANRQRVVEGLGFVDDSPGGARSSEANRPWRGMLLESRWYANDIAYGVLADRRTICRLEP